ncbi:MAG TPA: hypothetical protein VNS19_03845 [Acidimicrobiales bacterium]|nr:hypothetical protein [Acidimicrobiales bacterium]
MLSDIHEHPVIHRELLLALVRLSPDGALGAVAAGPLESFLSEDDDDLRWLESQCAENPRLRATLAQAWCVDFLSEETLVRLDHAAAKPLGRVSS